ncbi:MAG: hypothetical protein LBD73_06700 [Deferribacteraceae bacterium]|jgi:hypothetical protein|nr:hypothetical protein [Deferribacteraceae bacterium]
MKSVQVTGDIAAPNFHSAFSSPLAKLQREFSIVFNNLKMSDIKKPEIFENLNHPN